MGLTDFACLPSNGLSRFPEQAATPFRHLAGRKRQSLPKCLILDAVLRANPHGMALA